jgi:hypothetical protein
MAYLENVGSQFLSLRHSLRFAPRSRAWRAFWAAANHRYPHAIWIFKILLAAVDWRRLCEEAVQDVEHQQVVFSWNDA